MTDASIFTRRRTEGATGTAGASPRARTPCAPRPEPPRAQSGDDLPRHRRPPELPEILDLVAAADAVFNTGHVSGPEAVRAVEAARAAGVSRMLVPCSHFEEETVAEVANLGAFAEFSFFFASHATQVGLTHVERFRPAAGSSAAGRSRLVTRRTKSSR